MPGRAPIVLLAGAITAGACGGDGGPAALPAFPADYAASYTQVRNCRRSIDHDLKYIRVLASPEALEAYRGRAIAFPEGAVVVKEQYGNGDASCSGALLDYTVMLRLADGASPATLDWTWQHVSADRKVLKQDVSKCTRCHSDCGKPPEGYAGTCAAPP